MEDYELPEGHVLVLRSTKADRHSHNNFLWPEFGKVACDDWSPVQQCGNGLHGLLWGQGNCCLLVLDEDAIFQVVAVEESLIVDLRNKVKFPSGEVIFSGDRLEAAKIIAQYAPAGLAIPFATATAGDSGTATAGDSGTATAGDSGTATAGDRGTATAGDRGTATAGYRGTATAGEDGCIAIQRWNGKRYKWHFADVDGETVRPNVPYRLNEEGEFVEVTQ